MPPQDEFEKLEGDLKKLYEVYMEKFRNLTYLEQIVDAYDRQQQVKVEVSYQDRVIRYSYLFVIRRLLEKWDISVIDG